MHKNANCPKCGTLMYSDSKQCIECYKKSLIEPKRCHQCRVIIYHEECSKEQWIRSLCRQCHLNRFKGRRPKVNQQRHDNRVLVLQHYGGMCACCKEGRFEFLAIDHINGGGNKHAREIYSHLADWIVKNNFPSGFQILCHNCNFAKHIMGTCPHNEMNRHAAR